MIEKITPKNELVELLEEAGYLGIRKSVSSLDFRDLMKFRVEKILMVSSLYDYYTIVEDGHLQEAIFNEYIEMNLYYAPVIKRAFTGRKAIEMLEEEDFDLVITNLRLGDIELDDFCNDIKEKHEDLPLVLLASNSRELIHLKENNKLEHFDKVFIWNGDRKVLLAIIKYYEDVKNAVKDCIDYGVTAIILVEDSPEFYSAFLPLLYTEVMNQSQRLIIEGMNSTEKMLRQRARPKILLADTYEEAWGYYEKYKDSLLGVITDLAFPVAGKKDPLAGIKLIQNIKKEKSHIPILLQSSQVNKSYLAEKNEIAFIDKNSRTLLKELRSFILRNFGFGKFVFKMPDGTEICKAKDIKEFLIQLKEIPSESLLYHSNNNHFSYWLIARTEFDIAQKVRPIHINQFENPEELREYLFNLISKEYRDSSRGIISVFSRDEFDEGKLLQLIGEGSIGGKARGLAFIDKILKEYVPDNVFPDVNITIPKSYIIGTDYFTKFIEDNNLYSVALDNRPDDEIVEAFIQAPLPEELIIDLEDLLKKIDYPIAVRSSSLLEDAMYQPFAGIYSTVMLPNSSKDDKQRIKNLMDAVKYVYVSTFLKNAKNYLEATGNRIEEEKMGIIIQEIIGQKYDKYFYPHFSGVIRSYNYYPFGKAKPKDGIVKLALGLGKTIVDGGISLRYSPEYPGIYPQFNSRKDLMQKSQTKFWALDLSSHSDINVIDEDKHLKELELYDAEKHGNLYSLASTYSYENDMLYQGISRNGPRIINFAPILKSEVFPLNKIIKLITKIAEISLNSPVEIEFAVSLYDKGKTKGDFGILQVRPMVKPDNSIDIEKESVNRDECFLLSEMALGNGKYTVDNIVYVKPENFDASKTKVIAAEIAKINETMAKKDQRYMLIGPGRWGSSDSWLGIPVDFSDITKAQIIVETQLPNMNIEPSQGSHFFHNLTSFQIVYLTIKLSGNFNLIDWEWLNNKKSIYESEYVRILSLHQPTDVLVDGKKRLCYCQK
jgi:CheY-like chemotaxis protein